MDKIFSSIYFHNWIGLRVELESYFYQKNKFNILLENNFISACRTHNIPNAVAFDVLALVFKNTKVHKINFDLMSDEDFSWMFNIIYPAKNEFSFHLANQKPNFFMQLLFDILACSSVSQFSKVPSYIFNLSFDFAYKPFSRIFDFTTFLVVSNSNIFYSKKDFSNNFVFSLLSRENNRKYKHMKEKILIVLQKKQNLNEINRTFQSIVKSDITNNLLSNPQIFEAFLSLNKKIKETLTSDKYFNLFFDLHSEKIDNISDDEEKIVNLFFESSFADGETIKPFEHCKNIVEQLIKNNETSFKYIDLIEKYKIWFISYSKLDNENLFSTTIKTIPYHEKTLRAVIASALKQNQINSIVALKSLVEQIDSMKDKNGSVSMELQQKHHLVSSVIEGFEFSGFKNNNYKSEKIL